MSSLRSMCAALVVAGIVIPAVPAAAATVTPNSGQVSVSGGQGGFAAIQGPTEVAPGTRIVAGPGGSATVSFANLCVTQVVGGTVYVVPAALPDCAAGQPTNPLTTDIVLGGLLVAGVGAGVIVSNANKPSSP